MAYKMFSRVYPSYHKRKGEKTLFVEKIWAGFFDSNEGLGNGALYDLMLEYLDNEWNGVLWDLDIAKKLVLERNREPRFGIDVDYKCSTIRALKKRKDTGDYNPIPEGYIFKPRVWSGEPYKSQQVQFAPNLEIKYTHEFKVMPNDSKLDFAVNGTILKQQHMERFAYSDGLTSEDFIGWFREPMERGQVLIFGLALISSNIE